MIKTIIPKDLKTNSSYIIRGLHSGVILCILANGFMLLPSLMSYFYKSINILLFITAILILLIPKQYKIQTLKRYFYLSFLGALYGSLSLFICFFSYFMNVEIYNSKIVLIGFIISFVMMMIEYILIIKTKHYIHYYDYILSNIITNNKITLFDFVNWTEMERKAKIKTNPSSFYMRILGILLIPIIIFGIFGKGSVGVSLVFAKKYNSTVGDSFLLYLIGLGVFVIYLFANKVLVHYAFLAYSAYKVEKNLLSDSY